MLFRLLLPALLVLTLFHSSRPPPHPLPASAPATLFSAERAMVHLREVARLPHPPGSGEHARVRAHIVRELERLGLEVNVQEATAFSRGGGTAARVRNVVARLRGSDPEGRAVLLAAHYDGVGAGPAASDDGSGVALLLETARAVKAGPPLRHDLLLLFSDAEEVALLGAAAFVRDHTWADDVGLVLNFEARGTRGRSVMFESSPGNGELVRALSAYGDTETSSFWTPIYRALPNDTDLSRLLDLRVPALNFAFVDGLERYHSAEDDTVHIDPGSLQHHGEQALFLTRRFGHELPSATRRDAVFFELPLLGLVRYGEVFNLPLAVLLCGLLVAAALGVAGVERGWLRDALLGMAGTLVAVVGGIMVILPLILVAPDDVAARGWRGGYAAALALASLAVATALWGLLRRRVKAALALELGVVAVWALFALLLVRFAPGASYLFLWPSLAAAGALLAAGGRTPRLRLFLQVLVVVVALSIVVPAAYLLAVVGLGVLDPGGMVIGFFTALLAWLLAPQLEQLAGSRRWTLPLVSGAATLVIALVCALAPRPADAVPTKSVLAYALDADAGVGWLASPGFLSEPGSWAVDALTAIGPRGEAVGGEAVHPGWVNRSIGYPYRMHAVTAPPVAVEGATIERVSDRQTETGRMLTLRVHTPPETLELELRLSAASIRSVAVDELHVPGFTRDGPRREWGMTYAAPPSEGVLLEIQLDRGDSVPELEVLARRAGLPSTIASRIPGRPEGVVAGLTGDVTVVRRVFPL